MVNGTGLQQAMASEDTTKVARIEQLLRCGCESLNASQGVALCLADDYTDVIARATLQKPPSLPLMPPLPFALQLCSGSPRELGRRCLGVAG